MVIVLSGVVIIHADPFCSSPIFEPSVYMRTVSGWRDSRMLLCWVFLSCGLDFLSGTIIGKLVLGFAVWVFSIVSPGSSRGCRSESAL